VLRRSKPIPEVLQELWQLLKDYARQETLDPLRNLGRYLGFGLAGMALLTLGTFLLALSGLRALQTQTGDVFAGWRSAFPYLIVLVVLAGVAVLAASRIPRDDHKPKAKAATTPAAPPPATPPQEQSR
jgi:hypothetical protein